jgi:hypothetical protein
LAGDKKENAREAFAEVMKTAFKEAGIEANQETVLKVMSSIEDNTTKLENAREVFAEVMKTAFKEAGIGANQETVLKVMSSIGCFGIGCSTGLSCATGLYCVY